MRVSRLLKCIGFALAVPLVLCVGLVVFALTPWGLQTGASLAQKFLPELSVGNVSGTLFDADISEIRYQTTPVTLELKRVQFSIANLRPLERHADIRKLHVDGLRVALAENQESAAETAASDNAPIFLPFSVALTDVRFTDTHVQSDAFDVAVRDLSLAASAAGGTVTTENLNMAGISVHLPETPKATDEKPEPLVETLNALFAKPLLEPFAVPELPLTVDVKALSVSDVKLNDETVLETLSATFTAAPQSVHIAKLIAAHPAVDASVKGEMTLGGIPKGKIDAAVTARQAPLSAYPITAAATFDLTSETNLRLQTTSAQKTLNVQANIETAKANPAFRLAVTGDLDLTALKDLIGTEAELQNIDVKLAGTYDAYDLSISTRAASALLARPADLSVTSQGKKTTLSNLRLNASIGKNMLHSAFHAALTDKKASASGSATLSWSDLKDLGKLLPADSPKTNGSAELALTASTAADFDPRSLAVDITSLTIKASLNDVPFTAQTTGHIQGTDSFAVKNLLLKADNAALELDAALKKETLSGTFSVIAPDLKRVDKTLRGSLNGSGKLGGTLSAPQLSADLHASSLQVAEVSLKRADISARITTTQSKAGLTPRADVRLTATDLSASAVSLKTLSVDFSGTQTAHTLKLTSDGSPLALDAQLDGHLDKQGNLWHGELVSAALKTDRGTWATTDKPKLSFDVKTSQATLSAHCWTSRSQSLEACLREEMHAGNHGSLALDIKNADFALIRDLLPPDLELKGRTDAHANVSWTAPSPEKATAHVELTGSGISVAAETNGARQTLQLNDTKLTADFTPRTAQIQSDVTLKGGGQLKADITVNDPLSKRELSGSVTVDDVELKQFNPVLASVSPQLSANGKLSAELKPRGTLEKPALYGDIKLDAFTAQGQAVPLDMKPSNVMLHFEGDQSELIADLETAQGKIRVSGNAQWSDPENPTARVSVKGDKVRVSLPPYVTAHVTPDVEASISLQNLNLSGSIQINQARITVNDLPTGAISASADEEIIEANQVAVRVRTPLKIESSLVIHLGDDVNLSAFGLKSELQGDVTVTQNDQNLGLTGTIKLIDGTFKAYGQDLVINKGNLTFAGPVNKPILDFEAIRNPDAIEDNVTAGIRIKGPSDAPQTELFTDPAMSQADAISYIMRGQGLQTSNDGDNAMLTSALLGMGLSQTGQLVSGIGEMLRISELNVSTAGTGNDSQVVVSGYVLPGLQVKYAMGIFDSVATLTLRYRLLARLFVEASSGAAQSLDVLYTFEF